MSSLPPNLILAPAQEIDLPSLVTIHMRSFHPVSEYHRKAIPDTPLMREWWFNAFKIILKSPAGHMLIVRDINDSNNVVGALLFSRFEAGEKGPGIWLMDNLTPDHHPEMYQVAMRILVEHRENLMLDQPHYYSNYKGMGIGCALLSRCCEIVDTDGLAIFVEANGDAEGFYWKYGFETRKAIDLPGDIPYRECIMIRPKKNG